MSETTEVEEQKVEKEPTPEPTTEPTPTEHEKASSEEKTEPQPETDANHKPVFLSEAVLLRKACSGCGCDDKPLMNCAACGQVAYCGAVCQKSNWSEHKGTCKIWSKERKEKISNQERKKQENIAKNQQEFGSRKRIKP